MEINQEALEALSLSDLIALKTYAIAQQKHWAFSKNNPCYTSAILMEEAADGQIDKKIANLFIF